MLAVPLLICCKPALIAALIPLVGATLIRSLIIEAGQNQCFLGQAPLFGC